MKTDFDFTDGRWEVFAVKVEGCALTVIRRFPNPCHHQGTSGNLLPQGPLIDERKGVPNLARRRYQEGTVFCRGTRKRVWVGRWLEDEIQPDGTILRVHRSEVLGALTDYPTKKLAKRALDERLAVVNSLTYRARPTATFAQFSERWAASVLTQYKPSTQSTIRSQLRKYLVPFFGKGQMREMNPENVQEFVSKLKVSPKTARNLYVTLQMMWKSAKAWRYVGHEALDGAVLPRPRRVKRHFFSLEEIQRIVETAPEPYRTFFWLAAETGMRAGELCGLTVEDLDFARGIVLVRQSVWRGMIHEPKTENGVRAFSLSPQLTEHLKQFLLGWRRNRGGLLFATRNETPWDANLILKRKLKPLLESLGIADGGLHAFRHGNETLMDRVGAPLKLRIQRLGHSHPRFTLNVYTHVASEDDERVAAQLGELISGIPCPSLPKSKNEGVVRFGQPLAVQ